MAILNSLEGPAHVESSDDLSNWNGYVLLDPNPLNIRYFDVAGPASEGIYEGPVMVEGDYHFANGNVLVRNVNFTPSELRVDFVGSGKLNLIRPLSRMPDDYIQS